MNRYDANTSSQLNTVINYMSGNVIKYMSFDLITSHRFWSRKINKSEVITEQEYRSGRTEFAFYAGAEAWVNDLCFTRSKSRIWRQS